MPYIHAAVGHAFSHAHAPRHHTIRFFAFHALPDERHAALPMPPLCRHDAIRAVAIMLDGLRHYGMRGAIWRAGDALRVMRQDIESISRNSFVTRDE